MPEQQQFAVGDAVAWSTQGKGMTTEKRGVVAAKVPPQGFPMPYYRVNIGTMGRNHESYVIRVQAGKTKRAQPKYYWPVVSGLRRIEHTDLPRVVGG